MDIFDLLSQPQPHTSEETEKSYILKVEMPGFSQENIVVEVSKNNTLDVSGTNGLGYRRKYSNSWKLPLSANCNEIQAETKDGILTVTIPKLENYMAKKIVVSKA